MLGAGLPDRGGWGADPVSGGWWSDPCLVPLLCHTDNQVVAPALKTLGNITNGTEEQMQAVLDGGILPHLHTLMENSRHTIVKHALWILANIFAGNRHQIQMVVDANLVPAIIKALQDSNSGIWKEAVWAATNFIAACSKVQISYVVQQGVVPALCNLLDHREPPMVQVVLVGLDDILEKALPPDAEVIGAQIKEAGGPDKIKPLQQHDHEDVHTMAYKLYSSLQRRGVISSDSSDGED